MNCVICGSETKQIFSKRILNKYNARYNQCIACKFIQVENPNWLMEAYTSPIVSSDIGLLRRNIYLSDFCKDLIINHFDTQQRFLDFAGGYGVFVRLMRDHGFDFYREDKYCKNLFADFFDIIDLKESDCKFELITAFEVLEHVENPAKTLDFLFSMTDNIFFSTELVKSDSPAEIENWNYLAPEAGQHISFYSITVLQKLAKKYDCHLYSDFYGLHLLTKKKLKSDPFRKRSLIKRIYDRFFVHSELTTRLHSDHQWIQKYKL